MVINIPGSYDVPQAKGWMQRVGKVMERQALCGEGAGGPNCRQDKKGAQKIKEILGNHLATDPRYARTPYL